MVRVAAAEGDNWQSVPYRITSEPLCEFDSINPRHRDVGNHRIELPRPHQRGQARPRRSLLRGQLLHTPSGSWRGFGWYRCHHRQGAGSCRRGWEAAEERTFGIVRNSTGVPEQVKTIAPMAEDWIGLWEAGRRRWRLNQLTRARRSCLFSRVAQFRQREACRVHHRTRAAPLPMGSAPMRGQHATSASARSRSGRTSRASHAR